EWQTQASCEAPAIASIHCGQTPSVVADYDGVLHAVFAFADRVYYTRSDDGGDRFSLPTAVNATPEPIYSRGENRPKIALDDSGRIYASWSKKTEGRFNGDVRFSRSTDRGKTFSPPVTVNEDGLLTTHRFDTLAVDRRGDVYLAWIDKRDKVRAREAGEHYAGAAIYYAVSTDGGLSFDANRKLVDNSCECCRLAAHATPGADGITLMWRHIFTGSIRDHAIAHVDGRRTAAPAIARASIDDWKIDACPHHGPAIASSAAKGESHMVWFSNGQSRRGIHYGQFSKEGVSALSAVDGSASASHADILRTGDTLQIVWKKTRPNRTEIMLMTSRDRGATWESSRAILSTDAGSDYPFLVAQRDAATVVWKTADRLIVAPLITPEPAIRTFTRQSLRDIESRIGQAAHVVMLWSVDCPPCLKDLALLSEIQAEHGTQPVTLIATDPLSAAESVKDYLSQFALRRNESWVSGLDTDQLRAAVDPDWFGELPRTYMYDRGVRKGVSGQIKADDLRAWLKLGKPN
ncbi:MAG: hypothetical protein AAF610_15500, partial [Pseudomonadota bacterium]